MAKVLLDGVEQKFCITADEEIGEILIYVTDGEGRFARDPATGEDLKEWRCGKVEIVMPEAEVG